MQTVNSLFRPASFEIEQLEGKTPLASCDCFLVIMSLYIRDIRPELSCDCCLLYSVASEVRAMVDDVKSKFEKER